MLSMLFFFFFNDTATTEIYTLSLHDALPISCHPASQGGRFNRFPLTALDDGRSSEEHTSELQSPCNLVCRLLLETKKKIHNKRAIARTKNKSNTTIGEVVNI